MLCSCAGKTIDRSARLKEIELEQQELKTLYSARKISQEEYSNKSLTLLDEKFYLEVHEDHHQHNRRNFAAMTDSLKQENRSIDRHLSIKKSAEEE